MKKNKISIKTLKSFFVVIIAMILPSAEIFSQNTDLENKENTVIKALKILKNDDELKNAGIGFFAIDVNSGEIIGELNGDLALKPASTLKIVTTATALEIFGSSYKFKTEIFYDGKIDTAKKVLNGNIHIVGGGDPTLGSKYFSNTRSKQFLSDWANAIKKLGIDSINGQIIADATIYSWDIVPPTWAWEDMANYFGAGACGLSVYDNRYTLYFNTSSRVGGSTNITKIEPEIPGLTFENTVKSANTNSDKSYIFGEPYSYSRYIRGELPLGRTDYKVKGSMPDPAWYTAYELEQKLISEGIKISQKATTIRILQKEGKLIKKTTAKIHTTYSPMLAEIVGKINKHSINHFAEHLLNHIGLEKNGHGYTKDGANAVETFWASKGMPTGGMSQNDGSGLSHYNTITAKQLVFILAYMKTKSRNSETFFSSLPIAGKSGTLKSVCKGTVAEGMINAKSGSVRNVRCYTGYATSYSGREIAFAMMLNNFNCSSYKARKKLENLMLALVKLSE